jgi:hypothetical protein
MKRITQIVAAFICAAKVFAATETHTVSIPEQPTDFTSSVTLPEFDPAVGTLNTATLYIVATNNSFTRVENLNRSAATTISGSTVNATVTGFVTATASNLFTNSLARYDGVTDYDGTSGVSNAPIVSSAIASIVLDSSTVQGTGFFTLHVTATATSSFTGTSAYSFNVSTKAAVLVKIVYDFTPDCPPTLVYVKPDCSKDDDDHSKERDCDKDREYKTEKCSTGKRHP